MNILNGFSSHFRDPLELACPKLFSNDVPLIDIQFMPQDGHILRNRDTISSLDLSKTVFLKSNKSVEKTKSDNKEIEDMQKKQIKKLNDRLTEINNYKEKVKKLANNDQDLSKVMEELNNRLLIEYKLVDKDSTLEAIDELEKETKNLKFQLEKINFDSFDLKQRCEELIKVHGIKGFCYEISDPIISPRARTRTFRFSSQNERFEMNKSVKSMKHKGAFGVEGSIVGFGYGGIGMVSACLLYTSPSPRDS